MHATSAVFYSAGYRLYNLSDLFDSVFHARLSLFLEVCVCSFNLADEGLTIRDALHHIWNLSLDCSLQEADSELFEVDQ